MTSGVMLPCLRTKFLPGWPKKEEAGGEVHYLPIGELFRTAHDTDAHFAAYSVPELPRRLTVEAVQRRDRLPDGIPLVAFVFDADCAAGHKKTVDADAVEAWWLSELPKLEALEAKHPGAFIYRTRGGYRGAYMLPAPVMIRDDADKAAWRVHYLTRVAYLKRTFGIAADPSCVDWTRLYRLPCVMRDGVREARATIGNADAIGTWSYDPTAEDASAARALGGRKVSGKGKKSAPRSEEQPATVIGQGVLFHAFRARGDIGTEIEPGKWSVRCPWAREHSMGEGINSSTILYAPSPGEVLGWFHCSHAHCAHRDLRSVLALFTLDELAAARAAAGVSVEPGHADVKADAGDWRDRLLRNDEGRLLKNPANVMTVLSCDERWAEVIAFDAFAEAVVTSRVPPMRENDRPHAYETGEWTEEDSIRTAAWLATELELDVAPSVVDQAVAAIARRTIVHPVRDYLRGLAWDGSARLDAMLVSHFGAEDTPYTRGVGSRWMISAVARVFEPGCQADCTLVLESQQQGVGKSTGIEALASKTWFADTGVAIGDKDSYQALRRKWIYELGELDALKGRDVTRTKNFLSARSDNYRPSFGRRNRDFPRQCVFAGTTNESEYLEDRTGNRRFWPVRVGRVDVAALTRDRDQLWAEARVRYERGDAWHVDTVEFRQLCEEQQGQRTHRDPWCVDIGRWLASEGCKTLRARQLWGITTRDALVHALNIQPQDITRAVTMRAADVLKELGWSRRNQESLPGGVRERLWRPSTSSTLPLEVEHDAASEKQGLSQPAQPTQPSPHTYTQEADGAGQGQQLFPRAPLETRFEVEEVERASEGHAFSDLLGEVAQ